MQIFPFFFSPQKLYTGSTFCFHVLIIFSHLFLPLLKEAIDSSKISRNWRLPSHSPLSPFTCKYQWPSAQPARILSEVSEAFLLKTAKWRMLRKPFQHVPEIPGTSVEYKRLKPCPRQAALILYSNEENAANILSRGCCITYNSYRCKWHADMCKAW